MNLFSGSMQDSSNWISEWVREGMTYRDACYASKKQLSFQTKCSHKICTITGFTERETQRKSKCTKCRKIFQSERFIDAHRLLMAWHTESSVSESVRATSLRLGLASHSRHPVLVLDSHLESHLEDFKAGYNHRRSCSKILQICIFMYVTNAPEVWGYGYPVYVKLHAIIRPSIYLKFYA